MLTKLKRIALSITLSLALLAPAMMTTTGLAVAGDTEANIRKSLCQGTEKLTIDSSGTYTCTAGQGESSFNNLLSKVINIFSVIVGVIAVIMIIIGGFRYITSGGKEEGIKGAKNTIVYALIGLVVVALAQVIVKFVLTNTPT